MKLSVQEMILIFVLWLVTATLSSLVMAAVVKLIFGVI